MTPAERKLHVAVFHATQTTATIVNSVVKAAHGEQVAQRGFNLDRAIANTEHLLAELKTTKVALEQDNTSKPKED